MPNKHNADRRHHFGKMKFKVRNWASYEAGLRRRGSLTLWVTDEAIAKWQAPPRQSPGGQAHYSDMAIETALMLRLTFHLPLRQTEGFMESIFALLGMTVSAPDHSTLSRRATTLPSVSLGRMPDGPLHVLIDSTELKVYGAGEWLQEKHGARARRSWRKLHLAVDAASGMIVAQTLTEKEIGDPSQVGPLLDQIQGDVEQVTADGAYDGAPNYQTVAQHGAHIRIVIPPHVTAVLSDEAGHGPSQRDGHIALIEAKGRLEWQMATGYGRRSLVETTIGRYKRIIGPQLRARSFAGQQTEAAIGVAVLNRMLEAGRPDSVRSSKKTA
jgi:IS5 family transposase